MPTPPAPPRFRLVIVPFAGLFRQRTPSACAWRHARALLRSASFAPGVHTLASALRVLGPVCDRRFGRDHCVPSHAVWCPRAATRLLPRLLMRTLVSSGPVVLGINDTADHRPGAVACISRLH
jgi:hypothetical protein